MNKGVTLIALIITIIVLLILAAVSIATLTGENGILSKANTAKTETEKASAREKVQIAVMGSFGNDGNINNSELKTNLEKVEGIDKNSIPETITGDTLKVVVDGYEVTIDKNGKVTEAEEIKEKIPITFTVMNVTFAANQGDTWEDFFELDLEVSKRYQEMWGIGKWLDNEKWYVGILGDTGSFATPKEFHRLTLDNVEITPDLEIQKDANYEYEEEFISTAPFHLKELLSDPEKYLDIK